MNNKRIITVIKECSNATINGKRADISEQIELDGNCVSARFSKFAVVIANGKFIKLPNKFVEVMEVADLPDGNFVILNIW